MDDITFFEIKNILESQCYIDNSVISYLIGKDLLMTLMNTVLPGYCEAPITFEPTYKRNKHTGQFSLCKKKYGLFKVYRLPGYADRVLIKTGLPIIHEVYDSVPMVGNDHYPVFYAFRVSSFTIAVLSWNIGNANANNISPCNIRTYFEQFGIYTDVLIVGFQEASFMTTFDPAIWGDIYDRCLHLPGTYLSHLVGFGLQTYILWNSRSVFSEQVSPAYNKGGLTKGVQYTKICISNKNSQSISLTIGNTHAPFTESKLKYSSFIENISEMLAFKNSDITCLFGDLNSRSILKTQRNSVPTLVKNITHHNLPLTYNTTKNRLETLRVLNTTFHKIKPIDFSKRSPLPDYKGLASQHIII